MGFIGFIVLGLIVGAIVKAVLPGRVGGGWITSLILGIVGAVLGGWLGTRVFGVDANEHFFSLWTWIFAFIGGLIVAGVWGAITGRKKVGA